MKMLIFTLLFIVSCSETSQSYDSDSYKKHCNKLCQKDFNTDVDYVGIFTGHCFCK